MIVESSGKRLDKDTIEKYYKTGEKDEYYEEVRQYLEMSAEKINAEYYNKYKATLGSGNKTPLGRFLFILFVPDRSAAPRYPPG